MTFKELMDRWGHLEVLTPSIRVRVSFLLRVPISRASASAALAGNDTLFSDCSPLFCPK